MSLIIAVIGWRHPNYAQVLQERPAVDFLEVHSENFFTSGDAALAVLEQGLAHYPVSLHGMGLSLGAAVGLDDWHLHQLALLVERIDPVRVGEHASFARGVFQGGTVYASDLLPIPLTTESLDALAVCVQDRLKRLFMVENLSSHLAWKAADNDCVWEEPAYFSALVRRTGCQLLEDENNIYVNALNAQKDGHVEDPLSRCLAWLDAMPMCVVGELHVAGRCYVSGAHGDIVIDDRGSRVNEPVWALYRHVVQRWGRMPTLVEWDADIPALDMLLDEARRADRVCDSVCERSGA